MAIAAKKADQKNISREHVNIEVNSFRAQNGGTQSIRTQTNAVSVALEYLVSSQYCSSLGISKNTVLIGCCVSESSLRLWESSGRVGPGFQV